MQNSVLVVDDEKGIRFAFAKALETDGFVVQEAETGTHALQIAKDNQIDVILLDMKLPDMTGIEVLKELKNASIDTPVIMMTAFGDIELAVEAMQLGADNFRTKPFNVMEMKECIKKALENKTNKLQLETYREAEKQRFFIQSIIGKSSAINHINQLIKKIAISASTTVLIQGSSGTGKELVARAIHFNSERDKNPFIEVNCTAIPESLLESELFGHEKGSFTDAKKEHKGIFEQANGGTLFLDEIGDMPLPMQAKLLRVLQEKRFKRVGGNRNISVDVRVIASTNVDLEKAVKEGSFREDLFYRLNVIPITLPDLNKRADDSFIIATYYLKIFSKEFKKEFKGFTKEAEKKIKEYSWPGNIRELKNVIERSVLLDNGEYINSKQLNFGAMDEFSLPFEGIVNEEDPQEEIPDPDMVQQIVKTSNEELLSLDINSLKLEDVEKALINKALVENNWNRNFVSKIVGINRTTLYSKIKKYGLEKEGE